MVKRSGRVAQYRGLFPARWMDVERGGSFPRRMHGPDIWFSLEISGWWVGWRGVINVFTLPTTSTVLIYERRTNGPSSGKPVGSLRIERGLG